MAQLKLAKLPDRNPVKLTISILPELHRRLEAYTAQYVAAYGTSEPLTELVPAMLAAFLDSDRTFARSERANQSGNATG